MSSKANQRISFYFPRESKKNTQENTLESNDTSKNILKELKIPLERVDQNLIPKAKIFDFKADKRISANNIDKEKSNKKTQIKEEPPQKVRRSARNLPKEEKEKTKKREIKKDPDISSLPIIKFKGKIKYAEDFTRCAEICDSILTEIQNKSDDIIPIGFDLEWPFSFQTGSGKTALAQICLSENVCYLLHVYKLKKLPAAFAALLSHEKVKLVGVNIKNDIWKIGRDFKEFPSEKVVQNNCLDSGVYLNKVLNRTGRWSLERLTAHLIGKRIDKNPSVRRSKWHILPLNQAQKNYAATDAYVSWLLHMTIEEKKKELADRKEEEEEEDKKDLQLKENLAENEV